MHLLKNNFEFLPLYPDFVLSQNLLSKTPKLFLSHFLLIEKDFRIPQLILDYKFQQK